jgi:hypothetical protein
MADVRSFRVFSINPAPPTRRTAFPTFGRLVRLAYLAPDIVEAIVEGKDPYRHGLTRHGTGAGEF